MILGWRTLRSRGFTGINVFRAFDWSLPIDELGRQCFRNFDDALAKLKTDPDSTRIGVPGQKTNEALTKLNTANLAALRSVPERFRKCVWLWSLAVVDDRRGRALWSQLPSWCHLALESEAGELEALSPSTRGAHWALMTLKPQHRRLHLSFADAPKGFSLARSPIEDIRFIKASELLRPSGHLIHPISLKLDQGVDEAPELLRFEE